MDEQHPLTEEIMYEIHRPHAGYCDPFGEDDMRGAADWQLEQVIKWLEDGPIYDIFHWYGEDALIEELKKAMRPQQLEDN